MCAMFYTVHTITNALIFVHCTKIIEQPLDGSLEQHFFSYMGCITNFFGASGEAAQAAAARAPPLQVRCDVGLGPVTSARAMPCGYTTWTAVCDGPPPRKDST